MKYEDYESTMACFKPLTEEEQKKLLSIFLLNIAEQEESYKTATTEIDKRVITANIFNYQLVVNLFISGVLGGGKDFLIKQEPNIKRRIFGDIEAKEVA